MLSAAPVLSWRAARAALSSSAESGSGPAGAGRPRGSGGQGHRERIGAPHGPRCQAATPGTTSVGPAFESRRGRCRAITLDRLPEPHVVGEAAAEPSAAHPGQPGQARCRYGRSVAVRPGGGSSGSGADAMLATWRARSASRPAATTGTVSPSISAEPASTAPSASRVRIRVRGGRRSLSSRAGSRTTQRPRSLISGRFASARAVISSALRLSSARPSVSCQSLPDSLHGLDR